MFGRHEVREIKLYDMLINDKYFVLLCVRLVKKKKSERMHGDENNM